MVELQSRGSLFCNAALLFFCVETPESRTQVYMSTGGELEVHANVTFEVNTAGSAGGFLGASGLAGAVSLPFDTVLFLPAVVLCDRFFQGWVDSVRELTMPSRKG